jgi:hypothetical protein
MPILPPFYPPRHFSGTPRPMKAFLGQAPQGFTRILIVGAPPFPEEKVFNALIQTSLSSDYTLVPNGAGGFLLQVNLASDLGGNLEQEALNFVRIFNSSVEDYLSSHVGPGYIAGSELPTVPLMPDTVPIDMETQVGVPGSDFVDFNTGNTAPPADPPPANPPATNTGTGTGTGTPSNPPVSVPRYELDLSKENVFGFLIAAGSIMFLGYAIHDYTKNRRIRRY